MTPVKRYSYRFSVCSGIAQLLAFSGVILLLAFNTAWSAEIRVMNSGGFSAAYRALAPEFERSSGHTLATAWGPSMGATPDAIPVRLQRGEQADVLLMVGSALEQMVSQGKLFCSLRVDLATSGIGMAVRKGAPKPDISTVDAFKSTLLKAKSIGYSDSASGDYLLKVLFKKMGIEEQIRCKIRQIPAEPVGQVVARGEVELGFQQISELLPVPGIDLVGPLPQTIQKNTIFSGCVNATSTVPEAAQALLYFLASPAAATAIHKSGMEPLAHSYGK